MIYNKLQQEAIDSKELKIVVVAPPGSGKTASLVGAIAKYRSDNPTDSITAITFTKKAASELHMKLSNCPAVETATIHSWSLKELNKLGTKHKFKVSLLTDIQIEEMLQYLCNKLGYYSVNYYLLSAFIKGNYNIDISDGTKARFQRVLTAYTDYKRNNGLYDFTDLPLYLYDMLNEYNERITTIDALFVDEFQDVDPIQSTIFTMIDAKKHFYIGDPDQSIYMFRGASSDVLDTLEGFTRLRLEENYRSYQNIINYATMIREQEVDSILNIHHLEPSWIKCVRQDEPGEVYLLHSDGDMYDVAHEKFVDAFKYLSMMMDRSPYILCRSNKQVKAIQKLGYSRNVSTVHQAKGLQYKDVIVIAAPIKNEEELNIAYVACTRAEDSLMVADFDSLEKMLCDMTIIDDCKLF